MIVEERRPPASLAGIVARLWYLDAVPERRFEKILPMPFVHVIVNLSDDYRMHGPGGAVDVADAFVSGLQSSWLVIEPPARIRHVGAELTPVGLHALAPGSGASSAGAVLDARAVLGHPGAVDALVDEARGAAPGAAIDALARLLVGLRTGEPDPLVSSVLAAMDDDPERSVADLAAAAHVAQRTLIVRFRAVTGTTPKQHAQVLRFHRVVDRVHAGGGSPAWADLAVAAGYADQPHVIRAFRRFSGWTPAEYHRLVAEHGPDAAHFVPLATPAE